MFNRILGSFLVFSPFGSVGALAKAGREQNYAAGAVALLGLGGELSAIASLGRGASLSKSLSSAESSVTTLANYYPPNDGALGKWTNVMVREGQVFGRYGGFGGRFAADINTPFHARSIPYGTNPNELFTFEVTRPFMMQSSTAAPWFGQIGFGTQYRLPTSIRYMEEFGYIKVR